MLWDFLVNCYQKSQTGDQVTVAAVLDVVLVIIASLLSFFFFVGFHFDRTMIMY
jgi:hypothetical protein